MSFMCEEETTVKQHFSLLPNNCKHVWFDTRNIMASIGERLLTESLIMTQVFWKAAGTLYSHEINHRPHGHCLSMLVDRHRNNLS